MPSGQGTDIAYHVQTVVDSQPHLIVDHAVTNAVTDQGQLLPMATAAQAVLGVETLEAVTDKGDYDGEHALPAALRRRRARRVQQCAARGITVYIARPHTSANGPRGLFTQDDFVYEAEFDQYRCPAGEALTYRFATVEDGRPMRYSESSACRTCRLNPKCTRTKRNRRTHAVQCSRPARGI